MGTIAESWKKGLEEFRPRCAAAKRAEDVSVLLEELVLFWASIKEHHQVGRFVLDKAELDEIEALYAKLKSEHLHRYGKLIVEGG